MQARIPSSDTGYRPMATTAGAHVVFQAMRRFRNTVRELTKIGCNSRLVIPIGPSRKWPSRLAKTLPTQSGMINKWLKEQGLLFEKELWVTFITRLRFGNHREPTRADQPDRRRGAGARKTSAPPMGRPLKFSPVQPRAVWATKESARKNIIRPTWDILSLLYSMN